MPGQRLKVKWHVCSCGYETRKSCNMDAHIHRDTLRPGDRYHKCKRYFEFRYRAEVPLEHQPQPAASSGPHQGSTTVNGDIHGNPNVNYGPTNNTTNNNTNNTTNNTTNNNTNNNTLNQTINVNVIVVNRIGSEAEKRKLEEFFVLNPDKVLNEPHLAPLKFLQAYVCNPKQPESGNVVRPHSKKSDYLMLFDSIDSVPDAEACEKWWKAINEKITELGYEFIDEGIGLPGIDPDTIQSIWTPSRWKKLRDNLEMKVYDVRYAQADHRRMYECLNAWRATKRLSDDREYRQTKIKRIRDTAALNSQTLPSPPPHKRRRLRQAPPELAQE